MNKYPEKTCEIDRLVRHPKAIAAMLDGRKTQQRRNGVYGFPGETFRAKGVDFEITGLVSQRLGEMSDVDVRAEGYADMDAYKQFILGMHRGMTWNDDAQVWVHSFQRVEAGS